MDSSNVSQDQQNIQNPSSVQPVGGMNKELETPIVPAGHIEASEPELILHPEVKEAGVEVNKKEEPNLTPQDLSAGLVKRMPSVSMEPTQTIQFPINQNKAIEITKNNKKVTDSILWMATSVLRQILKGGWLNDHSAKF